MLNRIAPRERNSINWPISYPWRGRSSSSARIINSALPFFNSRSGTGDNIYGNAIYACNNRCQLRISRNWNLQSANHVQTKQLESGKQEAGNEKVKDMNGGITGTATTPVAAAHAEMKTSGKQESRKWSGQPQIQELQVGRPLLWAPLSRRAADCAPYLCLRCCARGPLRLMRSAIYER